MTGAEALVAGYAPNYIDDCPSGLSIQCVAVRDGLVRIDFGHPNNPGDILRYNPDGTVPADNPFGAIWALGLRNPFTASSQRCAER